MSTDQTTLVTAAHRRPVPIKVGWFAPQGAGKTTSAALLSLALSVEIYNRAPVYVTDSEPGWQFLLPMFKIEGVELIQRTDPTFTAMTKNQREAEKLGACVWNVDSLTPIWAELMQSFKARNYGEIPINKWGDIREMWNSDYVQFFINTSMCCQALGRVGDMRDEIQDERDPNKTKLVKTGTRFKAGGSEDFGYEPHLLLEMSSERKAKTVAGSKREGEGRVIHRVDVLKDRTWALNGKVFRWSDKPRYEKGGYRTVWESIKPHWDAVQATAHVQIQTGTSSQELIHVNGDSGYAQRVKHVNIALEEFWETLATIWSGQDAKSKELRRLVVETIYGTRSRTAVESKPLEELHFGLRVLQAFEIAAKSDERLLTESELAIAKLEELKVVPTDVDEDDDFGPRVETAPTNPQPSPAVAVVAPTTELAVPTKKRSRRVADPEFISGREAEMLLTMAKRLGWREDELLSTLKSTKGVDGLTAIPVDRYPEIFAFIDCGGNPDKEVVMQGMQVS